MVEGVQRLNPEMLSEHEIERKIMYDFLQKQTIGLTEEEHLYDESLIDEAKLHLNELTKFEAWQNVDVPIANLRIKGEQFKLANVTFMTITEQELEVWKRDIPIKWDSQTPDGQVIARVNAPGDRSNAISYARTQVNLVLDAFRAFCFPFISTAFSGQSTSWQLEVVGDVIPLGSTPLRIDGKFLAQVGSGPTHLELEKNILSKLEQPQWELINKLILKTNRSNMERKLIDGIHWLSESTKPDTNNSKFAKISFALETLISGESQDEELKVRGITAMLAERAAFIAGKDLNDRLSIDKDIRTHYGKRSNIFHGSSEVVSLDDIDEFGKLIRRLALALLGKLDELGGTLSNVNKLERWVKEQKYFLPSNNSKELT